MHLVVFTTEIGARYGTVTSCCGHVNQRQGCTIAAQIHERILG
jgi:hypothetical protein